MHILQTKIFKRLAAALIVVAVCLFAGDILVSNNYFTRVSNLAFEERTVLLMDSLSDIAPDIFTERSNIVTTENLNYIKTKSGVSYLIVVDGGGKVLAHTFDGEVPSDFMPVLERSFISQHIANGDHTFFTEEHAALLASGNKLNIYGVDYIDFFTNIPALEGVGIHYGIEDRDIQQSLFQNIFFERQFYSLFLVLALFTVIIIYSKTIIKPITILTEYTKSVARHEFDAPLPIHRKDELGELATAMQQMGQRISASISMLSNETEQTLHQMDTIISNLNEGIILLDKDNRIVKSNRRLMDSYGLDASPGRIFEREMFAEAVRRYGSDATAWEPFCAAVEDTEDKQGELIVTRENNTPLYIEYIVTRHAIGDEKPLPFTLCVLRDITARRKAEENLRSSHIRLEHAVQERTSELMRVNAQLRRENTERRSVEQALIRAESRYRDIVDNAIEGIFQRSTDGRLLSANPALAKILGFPSVEELLAHYAAPGQLLCYTQEMENAFVELLEIRGWVSNLEFQARMHNGNSVWVSMNARKVADPNGSTLYYEAFLEDITSRKHTEAKLMHQAFHDPLTGLPNRSLFHDRLRMSMRKAKRNLSYKFAVLYLDLDRFKNINDNFGHNTGDEMLNIATEKLRMHVRDSDTVARFGGDEFAILLDDIDKIGTTIRVAKRIAESMAEPLIFHEQEVRIGASIGIVTNTAEYNTPEEILRDADTAMYKAKQSENRKFMVFNKKMREETMASLAMENDLNHAVERGEIMAHYQPLVEVGTGRVYGFESLMRWNRNGKEIISPATFIPLAEETNLINQLGECILELVCRQLVDWNDKADLQDIAVHVNISGRQLMTHHFAHDVQRILQATNVNPRQLIFEITESVFLDYGTQIISNINNIREIGIRFCLDDFGTGFSSLNYLRLLPLESVKLDRSFITELETDLYSIAILRNLISMGHDIGLKVITEGVETPSQVKTLQSIGGRYVQGFYFSKPLPAPEALEYYLNSNIR